MTRDSRSVSATLVAVCVAVLSLFVIVSPAHAAKLVDSYFGNPGSGTGNTGGLFNSPGGVAVRDSTGAVYVVDSTNHRVQQFDTANNFVRAWGTDVVRTGSPNDVSTSAFEVCDTQHPTTPNTAADCKQGVTTGTGTGGQFSSPQGIAVNQATGNVYVTEQGRFRVQEFTASGQFVRAWGQDVIVNTGTPANSNGTGFEVCDTQHPTTPNTPADCKAGVSGTLGGSFASTFAGHLSVVPAGGSAANPGNVLVADPGNRRVQEFTPTGQFVRAFGYDTVQPGGSGEVVGPPQNERQTVSLLTAFGAPNGGTFTLTYQAQTTVALAYNASAGTVAGALKALSTIGDDDVVVSGPGPWTVEFTGANAASDVPPLTGDGTLLSIDLGFGGPPIMGGSVGVTTDVAGGTPAPMFETCTIAAQCKAGVAGNGLGQFATNEPKRVMADKAGAVYTAESSANFRVQRFTAGGLSPSLFATEMTSTSSLLAPVELAYDAANDRVLVAARSNQPATGTCSPELPQVLVYDYTTSGELMDRHGSCSTIALPTGLAIRSSNGRVYLAARSVFVTPFVSSTAQRVWVLDDDGATPALMALSPAIAVTSSTVELAGTVNPNSVGNVLTPTSWRLQYSRNGVDWADVSTGSIAVANTTPVPVTGSVSGLSPSTTYRIRLVTQKPLGNPEVVSAELTFLTDAVAPEIRTTAIQGVGPVEATVSARVNPHGTPTSYRFEWGEQGNFDHVSPSPDASVGSGPDFVLVSQQLTDLQPGTTYQYRAVAISASEGSTVGPTRTFTTPAQQTPAPQGRAYELVSPADKTGGTGVGTWYAGVGSNGTVGVAAFEGERFVSIAYYGGSLMDGGFSYGTDAAFGERTSDGWINRPGFNRAGGFGASELAKLPAIAASSDDLMLTTWLANSQMRIFPELESAFGSVDPKGHALRDWAGRWELIGPVAPEQQVASDAVDYFSAVAPGGGRAVAAGLMRGLAGADDPSHPDFSGGADDLVCPSVATCNGNVYVHDVTAGVSDSFPGEGIRSLANVCTGSGPDRTAIPTVAAGKLVAEPCPVAAPDRPSRMISPRGASVMTPTAPLSRDGSRVFFLSPDHNRAANLNPCSGTGSATACPPQLYVRQRNPDGSVVTRWISQSAVPNQDASLLAPVAFEGATPDGDKVFFRTSAPLTPDDPNGGAQVPGGVTTGVTNPNSVDLYMYDLPSGPDPAGGTLTRISAGPTGAGDGNAATDPVGSSRTSLRAVGDDGSRVYFTTAAPLPGVPAATSGGTTSPSGSASQTTTKNLYLYDANRPVPQRWQFVANLPAASNLGVCAAKGSSRSQDGLGGDDGVRGTVFAQSFGNCVRTTSDGSFATFFTDGRLTADDPDGTSGDVYGYDAVAGELTRLSAAQGGIGGSYVCVTATGLPSTGTRCNGDPVLSGNGSKWTLGQITDPADPADRTMFFESASQLVPDDHNDVYDVYQWHNGKLSLLSTGADGAKDALYRGNDRTGTNVYFSTRDSLSWQDHDAVLDVYTARAGGGIAQPDPPPVCSLLAGSCQALPAGGVSADTPSTAPGGENAVSGSRVRLAVGQPSARARRAAARSGVLAVRVRSDAAGTATASATARVGKRVRRVGRASAAFDQAGAKTIKVRLNQAARRRLAAGHGLRVRVVVTASGARAQSLSVLLRRAGR